VGGDEFRLKFFPIPGSNDYVENTSTHRVIADLKITEVDIDFLNLSISQYSSRPKISVNALPFDYSCGGYSSSIKDFVDAINETASFNSACGTINNDQFELYHNFVPTSSALHCNTNVPFTAVNEIEIPFDNWYASEGNNQPHSGINYGNLAFIAQEVFADELPNGHSVFRLNMENGASFNFGKTGLQVLPSTIIENNSVVSIGELGESQSAPNSIVFPGDEVSIETGIDCGSGSVDILENGMLNIGDVSGTPSSLQMLRFLGFVIDDAANPFQTYTTDSSGTKIPTLRDISNSYTSTGDIDNITNIPNMLKEYTATPKSSLILLLIF
jgi:hypothetical protein